MSLELILDTAIDETEGVERALYCVAMALQNISYQIKMLGNGNAATQMGAIENLAVVLEKTLSR